MYLVAILAQGQAPGASRCAYARGFAPGPTKQHGGRRWRAPCPAPSPWRPFLLGHCACFLHCPSRLGHWGYCLGHWGYWRRRTVRPSYTDTWRQNAQQAPGRRRPSFHDTWRRRSMAQSWTLDSLGDLACGRIALRLACGRIALRP